MVRIGTWGVVAAVAISTLAAEVRADIRVVVLPFSAVAADPVRDAWIAKGVQQNVIMNLGQAKGIQAVANEGNVPKMIDSSVAIQMAKANKANLAVYGTYEVVGDQVIFTAHMIDASGRFYGAARTAGDIAKVLGLEDELGAQLATAAGNPSPTLRSVDEIAVSTSTTFDSTASATWFNGDNTSNPSSNHFSYRPTSTDGYTPINYHSPTYQPQAANDGRSYGQQMGGSSSQVLTASAYASGPGATASAYASSQGLSASASSGSGGTSSASASNQVTYIYETCMGRTWAVPVVIPQSSVKVNVPTVTPTSTGGGTLGGSGVGGPGIKIKR